MADMEKEGFEVLSESEKKIADSILEENYPKIQRIIKNGLTLKVQLKIHEKKKSKKYSIHAEAIYPGKILTSQAHDYDLARTIHKAMKKLECEAMHRFKIS